MKLSKFAPVLLLLSTVGHPCDFCMLGQGVSPYLAANGRGLTLDVGYIESDHVYDGAQSINSAGKKEAWLVYTLTGFTSVTEDLTVLVSVPYVSKTNIDVDGDTGINTGTLTTGIGDTTITGRYTLLRDHSFESTTAFGLLAGLKIPTGSTNSRDFDGTPVDRHALPGTGSFDFNFGLTGTLAESGGFQLTGDLVYDLTTTGEWAGRDHRYGDGLNFSVKGYYRVLPREPGEKSLMPFVGISGEWMGKETGTQTDTSYDPGLVNLSTGGTELLADIGVHGVISATTIASFAFSKAFYHHMNYDPAFDSDPGENYKLDFSLTYLF